MEIAGRIVGNGHPCYVIAEIGINHNGSIDIAKKLIDVAVDAGCDAVKFQKRTIDIVYSSEELGRPRESPFGTTNGDLKRGLEFGVPEYEAIDSYCREKGIIWFASPWDIFSVRFLQAFNIPVYKVASACLTDIDLLKEIQGTGKPVILSTGMSTEDEIRRTLGWIGSYNMVLMVSTSTYPCELADLNLNRIHTFKKKYSAFQIGFSNHHPGIYASLCAVAMGAKILEVHITLARSMFGSDHAASIEPVGLKKLVREIRDFELACGDGRIDILPSEIPVMEKLRRVK